MNPNQNTGSFMSPTGTSADPIQEAMARRGMGAGATAQSSITQASVPQSIPTTNPQLPSQGGSMGSKTAQMPISGLPPQTDEAVLIIRSLNDRLKTLSRISESQAIPPTPPTPGI